MKCIIVDDEPLAHQVLEHYIGQTPGLSVASKFRNAMEAFEYLNKNHVDLLFLDIEMPLVNGIQFLKALPKPPKTIFTTAYKQYAYEGFELDAVDYLLKPFAYDRFVKAVDKVRSGNMPIPESSAGNLLIKDKQGTLVLKQQHIIYIEGCRDYVKIFTAEKPYIIYHTLRGLLEKLDAGIFIQSHRSYIVNKNFINRIYNNDTLVLSNQTFIPIGQLYKKELIAAIGG